LSVALVARGITLAKLVSSARNGMTVDDTTLDLFASISDALKGLAAAIEQVEARVRILENER
jgi:predicted ATPase